MLPSWVTARGGRLNPGPPRRLAGRRKGREARVHVVGRPEHVEAEVGGDAGRDLLRELRAAAERVRVQLEEDLSDAEVDGILPHGAEKAHLGLLREPALELHLDAPERRMKPRTPRERRLLRVHVPEQDRQAVVAAKVGQTQRRILAEILLEHGLPVVIDGRARHARASRLENRAQPRVDPRAAPSNGEAHAPGERTFGKKSHVDQVDLREAVELVLLGIAHANVDDAAHGAAVLRAEVARVEIDLLEQLGGHHRRQPAKVIDERDVRAVDEDLGVLGRGPAHDEQAREARRARDARKVLQRAQRITVGAWRAKELALLHGALGHLTRGAFSVDDHVLDVVVSRRPRVPSGGR